MKNKIYDLMKKSEKKVFTLLMVFVFVSLILSESYANPKIVTGTVDLFKAVTSWLLLIIPVGAGAFAGWHALQKSMSEDDAVISQKNKLIKNTIIGAAIAMTADGLIVTVLSFYK